MKALALSLLLIPASLLAQHRGSVAGTPRAPGTVSIPVVTPGTAGALGGSFLSPGFSRPLGGLTPSRTPVIRNFSRTGRYIGPIFYVPNAFDTYALADSAAADARAERRASGSSAPVVVNQYFGSAGQGDYSRSEFNSTALRPAPDAPVSAPGDPIGTPENYYLIAYKDHSVYSALAYWVEDGTLHYVTTQNTHNQASLGLIDLDQTTRLNADRNVPFAVAR